MRLTLKILTVLVLVLLILAWFDQSRSFYCLSEGKCVTVWKRFGNTCYIIPDKYYGILKPSKSHIKTSNTQYLTLYFSNRLPGKMIVRNQGSSEGKGGYEIQNSSGGDWNILEYLENYKPVLYKAEAQKFNEVETSANYIDLDIKENYAVDKTGKKLK